MLRLILLRMWRERRTMGLLLLSMCLVNAFLALGPLYVKTMAASIFEQQLDTTQPYRFSIEARNAEPFDTSMEETIPETMGQFSPIVRNYAAQPGFQLCGLSISPELLEDSTHCYRAYGYPDTEMTENFTLSEGRYPQIVADATDESDIQAEIIISKKIADKTELELGSKLVFASGDNLLTVLVVGIVEPALPDNHAFFQPQTVLDIFLTPVGDDVRTDISFILPFEAYQQWFNPITDNGTSYVFQIDINSAQMSSKTVDDFEMRYNALETQFKQVHPNVTVSSWISSNLIKPFRDAVATAQEPISLLSFLILVLMLYNLVTILSLVLEQQGMEWAMIASRGGSTRQLVSIQVVTVSLLGIIACILSPLLAYGMLFLISILGPQAEILETAHLANVNLESYQLSLIATIISIIALTIPAWTAANKSLVNLKSSLSRPPKQAVWARYYLDVIFLVLAGGFLVRLYTLSTGQGIGDLLRDPMSLTRILGESGTAGGFSDVFNLTAPALLLTGAVMLWMRFFPFLIRLVGAILANGAGLTRRLSFWTVERDSAHYSQLVLLIIGTLALGTASLTLSHTRKVGAWDVAYQEIGADVAVYVDSRLYDSNFDWKNIPQVTDAIPLVYIPTGINGDGALIGLDVAALENSSLSDYAGILAPLKDYTDVDIGGLLIPEGTQLLTIDVYAEALDEGAIETGFSAEIQDGLGITHRIPFENDNPSLTESFGTYRANVEHLGYHPLTLTSFVLESRHSENLDFEHTIYLDNLQAVDSTGQAILINAFEPDTYDLWNWSQASRLSQILPATAFSNNSEIKTEGEHSLKVIYNKKSGQLRQGQTRLAIMNYREIVAPPLPFIVSPTFAFVEGRRSRFNRPLQLGDSMISQLTISAGTGSEVIRPPYLVVGMIDSFPSISNTASYAITDINILRRYLNTADIGAMVGFDAYYNVNQIWLDLEDPQADNDLTNAISTIPAYEDSQFAWNRYQEIQHDPLANSVTGILFAGFWVSLLLILLDFAFYMNVTIRRRTLEFATLQAIGWGKNNILNLLLVEQIAFISPALIIGVLLGILLSYLILPFLGLVGGLTLRIPLFSILGLLLILSLSFVVILRIAAIVLRRLTLSEVLRFGE